MVAKCLSAATISSISRPRTAGILLTIALAVSVATAPAATAQTGDITLTLVRHAQSAGNASGLIDTSTPGPVVTELGRGQALAVAAALRGKGLRGKDDDYDGVYASTMIRTQETAQPMADALREPVVVLPGLREIEAGVYEGRPEAAIADTYFQAPQQWLRGDRTARIPGSVDGNEFDARFDEAVQTIYDDTVRDGGADLDADLDADPNAIAYSHGAAIMMWVAMNVRGVDTAAFSAAPLQNTGYFVIRGNPTDGWNLITSRTSP